MGYFAYEMDCGWSFDGYYIPHLLELNWYFGEDPFTYKSLSKVRVHGLSHNYSQLQVAIAGMQTEYDSDYGEAQQLDLPYHMGYITTGFIPNTNYVALSDRGLSLQMKFTGRNEDPTLPEPAHVLQVMAIQLSPQGNGKRAD